MNKNDEYSRALQSDDWKSLRKKILVRDGFVCKKCGDKNNLQVHHKEYFIDERNTFFKPNEYPLESLVTLCFNCHQELHKKIKIPTKKVNKMKLLEYFKSNSSKVKEPLDDNSEFVNQQNYSVEHLEVNKSPFESVAQIVLEDYSKRGYDDSKIITDLNFLNDKIEKLKMECVVRTDLALQALNVINLNLQTKAENLKSLGITNALGSLQLEIENLELERKKILEYKNDFENGGKFWRSIQLSYQNGFKEGIVASQQ